ncbi:MAG: hypothetical protein DRJ40_06875 [Thermoprotei archaeon]|nr:MAG: hypothetical protein DRJ40_06875 [Thermoprotei archaeon]
MKLFTPGPVYLRREVLEAMSRQVISHRTQEFRSLLRKVVDDLKYVVQTTEGEVAVLTGSGTLAVESMVYSLIEPGDRVLLLSFGFFGERLRESLIRRGAVVDVVEAPLGDIVEISDVENALERRHYKALFTVFTETSTGVTLRELKRIAELAKKYGLLVCVDAISAIGGEEFYMDRWCIDAVAGCSQKCIGAPPGVSFVALSPEAIKVAEKVRGKPIYMDLTRYIKYVHERSETPYTPAINVLYGLETALQILKEEGLEGRWRRFRYLTDLLYERVKTIEFTRFPRFEVRSSTVAVLKVPSDLSAKSIVKTLREEFGIVVARGLGILENSVIRVGVMGYIAEEDIEYLVSGLKACIDILRS